MWNLIYKKENEYDTHWYIPMKKIHFHSELYCKNDWWLEVGPEL